MAKKRKKAHLSSAPDLPRSVVDVAKHIRDRYARKGSTCEGAMDALVGAAGASTELAIAWPGLTDEQRRAAAHHLDELKDFMKSETRTACGCKRADQPKSRFFSR